MRVIACASHHTVTCNNKRPTVIVLIDIGLSIIDNSILFASSLMVHTSFTSLNATSNYCVLIAALKLRDRDRNLIQIVARCCEVSHYIWKRCDLKSSTSDLWNRSVREQISPSPAFLSFIKKNIQILVSLAECGNQINAIRI